MKKEQKTASGRELWKLLREAKSIRPQIALACVLSLILVGCVLAIPKLMGSLTQALIDYFPIRSTAGYRVTDVLLPGVLLLGAVYALRALVSYLKMLLLNKAVSRYFTCNLRIMISDKIQRLPVSFVDHTPVGDVLSRMTDDVSRIGNSLHTVIDTVMGGFLQLIAIAVMLFVENWALALVVIVFVLSGSVLLTLCGLAWCLMIYMWGVVCPKWWKMFWVSNLRILAHFNCL